VTFHDVSPGDYYATCEMDTLYGGYFPGKGSPIMFPFAAFNVGTSGLAAPLKLKLDLAKP
jgi:hypothetical protein